MAHHLVAAGQRVLLVVRACAYKKAFWSTRREVIERRSGRNRKRERERENVRESCALSVEECTTRTLAARVFCLQKHRSAIGASWCRSDAGVDGGRGRNVAVCLPGLVHVCEHSLLSCSVVQQSVPYWPCTLWMPRRSELCCVLCFAYIAL